MAIQQAPARATGLPAADQGIQESVRDLHSHLERYAAHRPKSSAGLLIDCDEDRTLRAVLVGMLREADEGRKSMNEEREDEEQKGEEPELTFSEMMLSDIAEDISKVRRNTGFLAAVLLVYILVVAVSFVFFLFAGVVD
jgi:hypothetical protein